MSVRSIALAAPFVLGLSGAALAQTSPPTTPSPGGTVATPQSNSTGSTGAATVAPGGNPAESRSTDSSSGGNAGQPSRAAPQGGSSSK